MDYRQFNDEDDPLLYPDVIKFIMNLSDYKTGVSMGVTCHQLNLHFQTDFKEAQGEELNMRMRDRVNSSFKQKEIPALDWERALSDIGGYVEGRTIENMLSHGSTKDSIQCKIFYKRLGERKSLLEEAARLLVKKLKESNPAVTYTYQTLNSRDRLNPLYMSNTNYEVLIQDERDRKLSISLTGTELSLDEYVSNEATDTWDTIFYNGRGVIAFNKKSLVDLVERKTVTLLPGITHSERIYPGIQKLSKLVNNGYKVQLSSLMTEEQREKLYSYIPDPQLKMSLREELGGTYRAIEDTRRGK